MQKTLNLIVVLLVVALQVSAQKEYGIRLLSDANYEWHSRWEMQDSTRMTYKDTNSIMMLDATKVWRYSSLVIYRTGKSFLNTTRTYDKSGLITLDETYDQGTHTKTYWYYTGGKLDSIRVDEYDVFSGSWGPVQWKRYDAQGRLLYDEQKGDMAAVDIFKYTYSGNKLTEVWNERTDIWGNLMIYPKWYKYDVQGRMMADSTPYYYNTYNYDAQGKVVEEVQYSPDMNNNLVLSGADSFKYDAKGNLMDRIGYSWDNTSSSYLPGGKRTYEYDSLNNMLSATLVYWNTTKNAFDWWQTKEIFQYQRFEKPTTPPIGIASQSIIENSIHIYPNPAANAINISVDNNSGNKDIVRFSIYNSTGALIKCWYEPARSHYTQSIDVTELQAGNYYIRCSAQPQDVQQFSIIK